jgi:hypothetical protein
MFLFPECSIAVRFSMETIKINSQEYRYAIDFKNFDRLRKSLNSLTKKVYYFDCEGGGIQVATGVMGIDLTHY